MNNKYLEKIAGWQGIGTLLGKITSTTGRVAKKGAKAYGNQVKTSFGQGFKEYAKNTHGVTDKKVIKELTNRKTTRKTLRDVLYNQSNARNKFGPSGEKIKSNVRQKAGNTAQRKELAGKLKKLRNDTASSGTLSKEQRDARMIAGAGAAAGVYAGNKVYKKVKETQQNQDYPQTYY